MVLTIIFSIKISFILSTSYFSISFKSKVSLLNVSTSGETHEDGDLTVTQSMNFFGNVFDGRSGRYKIKE